MLSIKEIVNKKGYSVIINITKKSIFYAFLVCVFPKKKPY